MYSRVCYINDYFLLKNIILIDKHALLMLDALRQIFTCFFPIESPSSRNTPYNNLFFLFIDTF